MITIDSLLKNKSAIKHHAILLLSSDFKNQTLNDNLLFDVAHTFCEIDVTVPDGYTLQDVLKEHPDIFCADRERKILRREDVKELKTAIIYPPQIGKKRLFIIENCERLNNNAANSLLKILEEPPIPCLFLLTSSEISQVLQTIQSRCLKIFLRSESNSAKTPEDLISLDDRTWLTDMLKQTTALPNRTKINAEKIHEIIIKTEKITKNYSTDILQDFLVIQVSNMVKENNSYINEAKKILAFISKWKKNRDFHPSSFLQLTSLFLT